jgi:quinol-cytochrome oxidoreductase complex cytochrome b subunit
VETEQAERGALDGAHIDTALRSGAPARLAPRAPAGGLGAVLLALVAAQVVSGVFLAIFFDPFPADAWKSIVFTETQVPLGGFFRSLHRWGAALIALALIAHVLILIGRGAYRKPSATTWRSGIALILSFAAMMVTGYLLPWDFRAYWMILTMGNWLDRLPLFADVLRRLLYSSGDGFAPVSLWFLLHAAVLPMAACAKLAFHFRAMRRAGAGRGPRLRPVAGLAALLALGLLAAFGLQQPDFADPVSTSPIPQPDWLFFLFFQVTRYCQDALEMVGVFWLPAVVLAGLILLPAIDRGATRNLGLKWALIIASTALCLALAVVTFRTGSTTPAWSCPACHKEDFGQAFSRPPDKARDFSTRYDNKWLALHLRYPQYFWMMDADVPGW